MRTTTLSFTAAAVASVLAGCGSDTPDHDAYVREVTSICAAASQRHADVAPDFDFSSFDPETSDLTLVIPVIEGHVAISRETVVELAKVDGPASDMQGLKAHIELAEHVHDLADQEIAAARAGDRDEFLRLVTEEDAIHAQQDPGDLFSDC